ncbi:MAG: DUF2096 family protein [Oscillospiraceae bacterium]|nr:DUF2096 family protein [Oscillospiraceae bacterium]
MANNLSAAKVLDELMLELLAGGMTIPAHVTDDLKAGRSFASISARSPGDADIDIKAASVLESVEMNLLALAEISGGAEYAEAWQKRIIAAYEEAAAKIPLSAVKMVQGVPKSAYWVRVQTSWLAQAGYTDGPPESLALSAIAQEDGYTLIYGEKENVISFLKKIKERIREGD